MKTNSVNNIHRFLLLFTVISQGACSPTGDDPTQLEMSDIIGLWNSSEKHGIDTDVIYTRISSDGSVIEYDFDGDDVDKGLDCYQVDSGKIENIAANRFLISAEMHEDRSFKIELELLDNGHALSVHFLDPNNDTTILRSQIWTRIADDSLLDNEPSCQNETAEN